MSRKGFSILNHAIGILFYLIFLGYFGTSIASLVIHFDELSWYGVLLNALALIFELLGPFYIIYFMVQLVDGIIQVEKIEYDLNKLTSTPKLAVLLPVRNAHPKILEDTLNGFQQQTYKNFDVWICDDNSDEKYSASYKELAKKYNSNYYFGEQRAYKAGVLNQVYHKTTAEFIAIFDVDQIPQEKILDKFVAILEQNPQYAFVQARTEYRNVSNFLHAWEMISYYQMACAQNGKMRINNVIWHGCNACFRREQFYPIPEEKLSEDFDHTIVLLSKGYYGCWLDEVGALTLATDTFDHKMSQLDRWTTGQIGAFVDHWKKYWNSKLTAKQSLDLFITSTLTLVLSSLFIVGIIYAIIFGLKVPIYRAISLQDVSMVIMPLLVGIVSSIMMTATTIYSVKKSAHKISIFDIILYLIFSAITAPILLIPTIRGLLGKNKLIPGKSTWNRKIRLYLISSIYFIIGLVFYGLSAVAVLDNFGVISWYPNLNYFYFVFLSIAFMLTSSLPFVAITKKLYKKSTLLSDENIYI